MMGAGWQAPGCQGWLGWAGSASDGSAGRFGCGKHGGWNRRQAHLYSLTGGKKPGLATAIKCRDGRNLQLLLKGPGRR